MDNAIKFVDWMEAALGNEKVEMTAPQRSVVESVVAKSRFNLENQGDKLDLTDEEMSCFSAALVVFGTCELLS